MNTTLCAPAELLLFNTRSGRLKLTVACGIFFQALKDELSSDFYKSSTDIKESVIKTEQGRKLMQRRSAEGKVSK